MSILMIISFKILLFLEFNRVLSQNYNNDYYFEDLDSHEINRSIENINIIFTTHYDIIEMKLNEDFIQMESKTLKTHLLDPTELYINENGNYIIYETIGSYFICAMDISRPNTYGLTSTHILPNTLRANSKLSIDWIHDLFYWIKDKKQILVSEFASLHQPIVFANKVFDSITTLAVNPIDSLVIWVEFDSEYNEYLLQKTSQDGSNRTQIYKFKLLIKTLDFDYQFKRIYYLSAFELSSIAYDGTGRRVLVPEANAIFQFEIFRNHLYWIEYSDNKLFRSHLTQPSSAHQVFNLNNTVNRFEITGPGRQPFNINRCFMANCTDLCLPVDHQYYRCVCQQGYQCTDNQTKQLIYNSNTNESHNSDTTVIPTTNSQNAIISSLFSDFEKFFKPSDGSSDKSMNSSEVNTNDNITSNILNVTELTNIELMNTTISESAVNITINSSKLETITRLLDKDSYEMITNGKTEDINNPDKQTKNTTNFEDLNNKTFNENVIINRNESNLNYNNILIGEIKESSNPWIPHNTLYTPLAIGGTILITGLLIGAVIAAIVIRIYTKPDGKQVYDISPNNTVATDWDSVRFKKSEQNIYFGKFLVKDEYY